MFNEYKSNSSVMIVLEGQNPLGADAHAYYDQIVKKLEADTKHVEHVQDMWSDPLTGAGRAEQRRQGRLRPGVPRGQPGRGAGQRVGRGRAEHRQERAAAQRGQGLRHRPRGAVGRPAHRRRPQPAGDHDASRSPSSSCMLLLVYRSIVTVLLDAGDGGARAGGRPRHGRVPRLLQASSGSRRSPRTCWSPWRSRPRPTTRSS